MSQLPICINSGCGALVEVQDTAEPMMSSDRATCGCRRARREGDDVLQSLVIALGVVMVDVLAQNAAQVPFA